MQNPLCGLFAVAGVQFSSDWLWGRADKVMTEAGSERPACSEEAGLFCWLLDTAGRVVYASGDLPPLKNGTADGGGPHFGVREPQLMAALISANVFSNSTEYDYQGESVVERAAVSRDNVCCRCWCPGTMSAVGAGVPVCRLARRVRRSLTWDDRF